MNLTTRVGLFVGASALTLTSVSFADSSTEAQELQSRIAELEARVAQLSGGDAWLTEQRAEEIRGLVHDVLADADTRASLLQSGMSAGYDNGFMIGSADGNFSLKINGQLQTRLVYNSADSGNNAGADENVLGFENTRTKLMFSGNVGSPAWTYFIEGDFGVGTGTAVNNAPTDGTFNLDDAWINYDMGDGWSVTMGQFKVPLNREWLVHSSNQLAVERSLVGQPQNGGRTQGIALHYNKDTYRVTAGFTDGAYHQNDSALVGDTEFSFSARSEFLLSGNWSQFDDFTSKQGSEQGMMAGIGVHYEKGEYGGNRTGTGNDSETELLFISGDLSMEFDGANLFVSVTYGDYSADATTNSAPNIAKTDSQTLAVVAQGGYYFTDTMEGYVRYEWADLDNYDPFGFAANPGADDISILTVGVNNYYSANVKSSLELGFSMDSIFATAGQTNWRVDQQAAPGKQDGQFVIRGQLQLTF